MTFRKTDRAAAFGCALVLALALFALAGCHSQGSDAQDGADGDGAPAATAGEWVEVTLPSAYFTEPDGRAGQLEAMGCQDVVDNGDGSFTVQMPGDVYAQTVDGLKEQVSAAAQALEDDDATYPHVERVACDEGFTSVQVQLNTDMPGIEDTYALAAVGVPAATYQQVAGLPVGCQVDLVLQDGTVQQSATYPM